MNSRQKGARGEREAAAAWAQALRIDPATCRRGQQFAGGTDSPDVVQPIAGIHLEVKRVERGNPYGWMDQAVRDAGDLCPVVLHKRNRRDWLLVVRLSDVQRLAQAVGQQAAAVGQVSVPGAVPCPCVPAGPGCHGRPHGLSGNGRRGGAGADCAGQQPGPGESDRHIPGGMGTRTDGTPN